MQVITIRFHNQREFKFLLGLLRRLNIAFDLQEEKKALKSPSPTKSDAISELFGSWPSEQSSDELVAMLYDARVNQTREVSL